MKVLVMNFNWLPFTLPLIAFSVLDVDTVVVKDVEYSTVSVAVWVGDPVPGVSMEATQRARTTRSSRTQFVGECLNGSASKAMLEHDESAGFIRMKLLT